MANSIIQALTELNDAAQASDDEDFKAMNMVEFKKVDAGAIEEAEKRAGFALPPSYKKFVVEHGTFGIGTNPEYDHMSFRLLDVAKVAALHSQLEEDYEASTSADIADEMGVEEEHVAATKHGATFAMQGHEDYWVFDERSRDASTNECKVVGVLLEDCELEYFAERSDFSDWKYFEEFVLDKIASRKEGDFE
jgi:hypothetical protein